MNIIARLRAPTAIKIRFQPGATGPAGPPVTDGNKGDIVVSNLGSDWRINPTVIRERLASNRTYYVRTDGNDNNTGLSNTPGGAFQTIQGAYNRLLAGLDGGGKNVTIKVANGTYTTPFVAAHSVPGVELLTIEGNTTTPSACTISVTASDAVSSTGANLFVSGFRLSTTTSGDALSAVLGGEIGFAAMDFGACAGSHIGAYLGGKVSTYANYSITGSAASHYHCYSGGLIIVQAGTITLTGTPNFSDYFAGVAVGSISVVGAAFSGSATGRRYYSHKNGFIEVGGGTETYFPGNVAGKVEGGGRYSYRPEGWVTHNPTLSAASGTITSYTSSGRYQVVENVLYGECTMTITNAGTGSGTLFVSLPVAVGAGSTPVLTGYVVTAGVPVFACPFPGYTAAGFVLSGGGTPFTTGSIIQISYQYGVN